MRGVGSRGPQSATRRTPHPDSWRCGREGGTGQPAGARHRQTWAGCPSRGALRYPLAQMRKRGSERGWVAGLTFRGKECGTVMEPRPRAPSPGAQLSQRPLLSSWGAFHVAPPVAGKLAPFPKRSKRRTFPWKQFPARAKQGDTLFLPTPWGEVVRRPSPPFLWDPELVTPALWVRVN